jgi:acylphosphatase
MSPSPDARRLAVHGQVQEVNFRAATQQRAEELGLTGWVANQGDGTVAVHAEGDPDALDALVAWAHEGPAAASVERVDSAESQPEGIAGFTVR